VAKILIVDDSPTDRSLHTRVLGNQGHQVLEASDGAEALALASAERPGLVITDILMPTMDGYEFVRQLRSSPGIALTPVIFCTAHFRERDARDLARQCGVEFVLTKPCEAEIVLQAVEQCLGHGVRAPRPAVSQDSDREHLRLLTGQLAHQSEELRSANLRLEALIETILQLASEATPERSAETFCTSARNLISARYALVGVASSDSPVPDRLYTSGVAAKESEALRNSPAVHAAMARLLRDGRPLRAQNQEGRPEALGFPPECPRFRSLLITPIISLSRSYGWLCLLHRLGAAEFSVEDERLAGILGGLMGRVYENGRMYSAAQHHAAELEQEIADRRRAEEALRDSEAKYRVFFENNPLPGWVCDTKSQRFLAVNEAAIRHYGYSHAEFLALTKGDIELPAETGHARRQHLHKDGTLIDVEIVSHPTPGPQPSEFVLAYDVTERLRNEAAVRESAERLNLALRASRTGVWSFDAVSGALVWDAYAGEIFGFPGQGSAARFDDLLDAVHPADRELVSQSIRGAAPNRSEVAIEFRVVWPDTTVHYLFSRGQAFFDDTGTLARVVGVSHDITDQRRLEEQFRQSQKMEAVGRLAAGIAHDFNNLLTVILGYTTVVHAKLESSDPLRRMVAEARRAGEQAALLTGQLLAFSRKQVTQMEVLDINEAVRGMTDMLQRLLGDDIDLSIALDHSLSPVRADAGQFNQVLLNLAVNAHDAMPNGGRLSIKTRAIQREREDAGRHGVRPAGRYAMVAVSDTGAGMSAETLTHIFEPFFTTKDLSKGTGLGLSTVYGIVQQHGGWIDVASEPGRGASFQVYLPVARGVSAAPPSAIVEPALRRTGTILLVEDQAAIRMLLEDVLSEAGHLVLAAADGRAALDAAQQYTGAVDLLITDVVMPEMSGPDLASQIALVRPGMIVLFMSGYTDHALLRRGAIEQGTAFLQKPFLPESLLSKIDELLSARR
jgi:signal transduction histidine kinase/DNA-binding response OmpR family regulator